MLVIIIYYLVKFLNTIQLWKSPSRVYEHSCMLTVRILAGESHLFQYINSNVRLKLPKWVESPANRGASVSRRGGCSPPASNPWVVSGMGQVGGLG